MFTLDFVFIRMIACLLLIIELRQKVARITKTLAIDRAIVIHALDNIYK